jgi:hypothetical protein
MKVFVFSWQIILSTFLFQLQSHAEQRDKKMDESSAKISVNFNILADQWAEYCQSIMLSSNIDDYLKHPAYAKLVALGKPAIPYIMQRYQTDDLPWEFVLDDITGFMWIKDHHRFSPKLLKKRWLEWWKEHSDESFSN